MKDAMADTIYITAPVSIWELANQISDFTHEQILALIKAIDVNVADWDFTLALCDYCDEQRKAFDEEEERSDEIEKSLMQ